MFVQVLVTVQLKSCSIWNHLNFSHQQWYPHRLLCTQARTSRTIEYCPQTSMLIVGDVQFQLNVQVAAIEKVNGALPLSLS